MAFQIDWTENARNDLREIVKYIALDNVAAAAHLSDRILLRLETVSELPLSNRTVPEKDDDTIREIILRPYRIIYQIDEMKNSIHVLRIWNAFRGTPDI